MNKESRWYEIKNNVLYVYNEPYTKHASSVSICSMSGINFYKNNFRLNKVWGETYK